MENETWTPHSLKAFRLSQQKSKIKKARSLSHLMNNSMRTKLCNSPSKSLSRNFHRCKLMRKIKKMKKQCLKEHLSLVRMCLLDNQITTKSKK